MKIGYRARHRKRPKPLLDLIDRTELNAVVIDIKDCTGIQPAVRPLRKSEGVEPKEVGSKISCKVNDLSLVQRDDVRVP